MRLLNDLCWRMDRESIRVPRGHSVSLDRVLASVQITAMLHSVFLCP